VSPLPYRESLVRLIPLPAELDDQEVREMVLNHEAGLYLPYPREEADVDYQKLGYFVDEDGLKVQVLLVATRKKSPLPIWIRSEWLGYKSIL